MTVSSLLFAKGQTRLSHKLESNIIIIVIFIMIITLIFFIMTEQVDTPIILSTCNREELNLNVGWSITNSKVILFGLSLSRQMLL
jgi:dipeptide/tripeptide permease